MDSSKLVKRIFNPQTFKSQPFSWIFVQNNIYSGQRESFLDKLAKKFLPLVRNTRLLKPRF